MSCWAGVAAVSGPGLTDKDTLCDGPVIETDECVVDEGFCRSRPCWSPLKGVVSDVDRLEVPVLPGLVRSVLSFVCDVAMQSAYGERLTGRARVVRRRGPRWCRREAGRGRRVGRGRGASGGKSWRWAPASTRPSGMSWPSTGIERFMPRVPLRPTRHGHAAPPATGPRARGRSTRHHLPRVEGPAVQDPGSRHSVGTSKHVKSAHESGCQHAHPSHVRSRATRLRSRRAHDLAIGPRDDRKFRSGTRELYVRREEP